jgi:2-dehydro-3-deoxyphosphogluconate aldolase/(4S)-4-hydroxy-2-oxoglutarate aldolase
MCHRYGVAVLPGALTPTEIVTAWEAGADVVKVFPGERDGRGEVSEVGEGAAAAGGDDSDRRGLAGDGAEFLEAGAFALGVGADLVDLKAIAEGHPETITRECARSIWLSCANRRRGHDSMSSPQTRGASRNRREA